MSKIVLVNVMENGGAWCKGVFDNLGDAVVDAMAEINDSWNDTYNEVHLTPLFPMDGDGGYCMRATTVNKDTGYSWTEDYMFLFLEEEVTNP